MARRNLFEIGQKVKEKSHPYREGIVTQVLYSTGVYEVTWCETTAALGHGDLVRVEDASGSQSDIDSLKSLNDLVAVAVSSGDTDDPFADD